MYARGGSPPVAPRCPVGRLTNGNAASTSTLTSVRTSYPPIMAFDTFASSRLLSEHPAPQDTNVEALRRLINRKHGLHLSAYS